MNIFIAGLSYQISETDLRELFEEYGEVSSARIITDRDNPTFKRLWDLSKWMMTQDGQHAIDELNGGRIRRTYPPPFRLPAHVPERNRNNRNYGNRDYHERNRYWFKEKSLRTKKTVSIDTVFFIFEPNFILKRYKDKLQNRNECSFVYWNRYGSMLLCFIAWWRNNYRQKKITGSNHMPHYWEFLSDEIMRFARKNKISWSMR